MLVYCALVRGGLRAAGSYISIFVRESWVTTTMAAITDPTEVSASCPSYETIREQETYFLFPGPQLCGSHLADHPAFPETDNVLFHGGKCSLLCVRLFKAAMYYIQPMDQVSVSHPVAISPAGDGRAHVAAALCSINPLIHCLWSEQVLKG